MNIEEFKKCSPQLKCEIINKQFETHNIRNFKDDNLTFSFVQAKKILDEQGIVKIDNMYYTNEDAKEIIESKKNIRNELVEDDIKKLLSLLEGQRYETLLKLTDKYDYITNYILNEAKGISIKLPNDKEKIKASSVRMYDETFIAWQEFQKKYKQYTALDLLNTAITEFMEKYKY